MFIYFRQGPAVRLTLTICAALLIAVSLVPAVFAQGYSEEAGEESDAAEEVKSDEAMAAVETGGYITGNVVGVNPGTHKLAIVDSEYGGDPYIFFVNKSTTFTTASSLGDIGIGDSVTVDYFSMGDSKIAQNIILEEKANTAGKTPSLEKVLSD